MTGECGTPSPFPLLIKGQGRGSAAPLDQSRHQRRRESRLTAAPTSDGPVSRLHRLPPEAHEGRVANMQNRGDG